MFLGLNGINFFIQSEMMSDTIDDTLDDDEAEEETDELTNQVGSYDCLHLFPFPLR